MRIQFDISKRPQIESGEYKVVYVENSSSEQCPVEILKWNSNSDAGCIIGCVRRKGKDRIYAFQENGVHTVSDEDDRLFIVTPEPEMSEFEKALDDTIRSYRCDSEKDEDGGILDYQSWIKRKATSLLDLAKQQLLQSGELLTQEHHEKLMEVLNNAYEEELEKAYKNADEVQYRKGREDALKDLPRWRKCEKPFDSPSNCGYNGVNLINHGYALSIDDAYTKLPKDE